VKSRQPVGVYAALLLALCIACTGTNSQPATPAPSPAPSATAVTSERTPLAGSTTAAPAGSAATVPSAQTAVAVGQTLLQRSRGGGAGDQCCTVGLQTDTFTASGAWDLNWEYDCGATGRSGNLSVDVFGTGGSFVSDPRSLFLVGTSGQGVQSYDRAGTYSLVVNSVCRWALTVTMSARPTATPIGSSAGPAPTVPAGLAAMSVPSAATAAATSASSTSSLTQRGLQALQPAVPTPRPAVPSALGAFSAPGPGASRAGAGRNAASGRGAAGISSTPVAPSVSTATPLRAATPTP
jgi:hypothetical protein